MHKQILPKYGRALIQWVKKKTAEHQHQFSDLQWSRFRPFFILFILFCRAATERTKRHTLILVISVFFCIVSRLWISSVQNSCGAVFSCVPLLQINSLLSMPLFLHISSVAGHHLQDQWTSMGWNYSGRKRDRRELNIFLPIRKVNATSPFVSEYNNAAMQEMLIL